MRQDSRDCTQCHIGGSHDPVRKAPMFAGVDVSHVTELSPSNMSGDYLERLRKLVSVKLLVKGIVTAEDATLAMQAGVDGIVVSNHGGRQEETLRSTIECLPEIVAVVGKRIPVFIDGGIRRGTDIFKALALGATAVGVGATLLVPVAHPLLYRRTTARCSTRSAAVSGEDGASSSRSSGLVIAYGGLATTRNGRRGSRMDRASWGGQYASVNRCSPRISRLKPDDGSGRRKPSGVVIARASRCRCG
jgi:imidazole glycerol phosphate synthase subunit HisF